MKKQKVKKYRCPKCNKKTLEILFEEDIVMNTKILKKRCPCGYLKERKLKKKEIKEVEK